MSVLDRFHEEYDSFHEISAARSNERLNLLREFETFAGVPIEQTDDSHLRAFLGKLSADGLHPNTIRKKRGMLLPFFGWAFDVRLVDADTFTRMQRVRNPRGASGMTLPKPYSRKEIAKLWADIDKSWPSAPDWRMPRFYRGTTPYRLVATQFMQLQILAVTHLALHAGMRRDEIYYASLNDLHYDNAYVVVRHAARKNATGSVKPREVPMTDGLSTALYNWIEWREMLLGTGPKSRRHRFPWLSLAANGPKYVWLKPMRHERFEELLGTVGKGYQLHRLRHTCGTEWLRNGLPLEQVQRLLGHSRIQQTLSYAQILSGDLEKGMGKVASDFQTAVGRPSE